MNNTKVYRPVGVRGRLSYPFWIRNCQYYSNPGCHHMGTDYGEHKGADIFSVLDGTVIEARVAPISEHCGYGTRIIIEHDAPLTLPTLGFVKKTIRKVMKKKYFASDKIRTTYAHLSSIQVKVGDVVKGGQKIGEMGDTGVGDTHLHNELNYPEAPTNENYVETKNCGLANGYKVDTEINLLTLFGETPTHSGVVVEPQGMVTRECPSVNNTTCPKTGRKLPVNTNVAFVDFANADGYTWGKLKTFENMPTEWVATSRGNYNYIELTELETPVDPPDPIPNPDPDPNPDCEKLIKAARQEGRDEVILAVTKAMEPYE